MRVFRTPFLFLLHFGYHQLSCVLSPSNRAAARLHENDVMHLAWMYHITISSDCQDQDKTAFFGLEIGLKIKAMITRTHITYHIQKKPLAIDFYAHLLEIQNYIIQTAFSWYFIGCNCNLNTAQFNIQDINQKH